MFNLVSFLKRGPVKRVEKSWGYEDFIVNDEKNNYCGKILHIKKGHRFSAHFHREKQESFFLARGRVNLWLIDTTDASLHHGVLEAGDCIEIGRLVPHEVEAIEDSDIIEFSTFHRDDDSYRVWRKESSLPK